MNTSFTSAPIPIGGRVSLLPNEIVWLEANLNYTTIYLISGEKLTVSYNLGMLHERLSNTGLFIRPNRKEIFNLKHLEKLDKDGLELTSRKEKMRFSRRRQKNSINKIMAFNPKISKL